MVLCYATNLQMHFQCVRFTDDSNNINNRADEIVTLVHVVVTVPYEISSNRVPLNGNTLAKQAWTAFCRPRAHTSRLIDIPSHRRLNCNFIIYFHCDTNANSLAT